MTGVQRHGCAGIARSVMDTGLLYGGVVPINKVHCLKQSWLLTRVLL